MRAIAIRPRRVPRRSREREVAVPVEFLRDGRLAALSRVSFPTTRVFGGRLVAPVARMGASAGWRDAVKQASPMPARAIVRLALGERPPLEGSVIWQLSHTVAPLARGAPLIPPSPTVQGHGLRLKIISQLIEGRIER